MKDVVIVGAGIGGLTLGLMLHHAGIPCRIYEAAPSITAAGVGINLLPHATKELAALGLDGALAQCAVKTKEATFYNRFGQLIWCEPLGQYAGFEHPQFSVHRADLQRILLEAYLARAGQDALFVGHRITRADQDEAGVTLTVKGADKSAVSQTIRGAVAIACDGIHSAIRKQFYPDEGPPRYSGINMWRGTTRWKPFLSGASLVRAGWMSHGKMVIYPIRENVDPDGRQLVNWVAEVETPVYRQRDWNRPGSIGDFIGFFSKWRFEWLDVPGLIRAADSVLEFPMVDQDPLPRWSFGRVTLLGDAAHPMVPRGSNGAGQAIVDARALTQVLKTCGNAPAALKSYEDLRRLPTSRIVLANRTNPPDAILREVFLRTGDRPFENINDVIKVDEIKSLLDDYNRVTTGAVVQPD